MEISVIVPVYNVEDKLQRCVNSILEQTFTDFELLLIDDGSIDNSSLVCDQFAQRDARIKVIHQENAGVSCARNRGLKLATGKYIVFVDSDDYVDGNYLKVMYDTAQLNNSELVISGVSYCNYQNIEQHTTQDERGDSRVCLVKENSEEVGKLIDDRRLNYIYAKMFRKEILDKFLIRFSENISLGEDTIFVMHYLSHITTCDIVGQAYYYYIKYNSGTLTSIPREGQYEDLTVVNNEIERYLVNRNMWTGAPRLAVEKRRILSAYWTIDAFYSCSKFSFTRKINGIKNILNVSELRKACQGEWDKKKNLPYAEQIKKNNTIYIVCMLCKDRLRHKVEECLVSVLSYIVPEFLKRWRRQWKNNAQL